jgi:hypothetical protein
MLAPLNAVIGRGSRRLTPDKSHNRTYKVLLHFSGKRVYQALPCRLAAILVRASYYSEH